MSESSIITSPGLLPNSILESSFELELTPVLALSPLLMPCTPPSGRIPIGSSNEGSINRSDNDRDLFSVGFLEDELYWDRDNIPDHQQERADECTFPSKPHKHTVQSTINAEYSYNIKNFRKGDHEDGDWVDEDLEEIIVMSKKSSNRFAGILEDLSGDDGINPDLPTPLSLAHFDLIHPFPAPPTPSDSAFNPTAHSPHPLPPSGICKVIICRERSTQKLYELRTFRARKKQKILEVVSSLKSPFLPNVYSSWREKHSSGGEFCVVLDWNAGPTLSALVSGAGPLEKARVTLFASEVVDALLYLHKRAKIIHRALSPETIVLTPLGHIVITEFTDATSLETMNLCSEWLGNKSTAARETLLSVYRAPEIVLGWKHEYKVDCWGFGLVLHFMIFGKHPKAFKKDTDTSRGDDREYRHLYEENDMSPNVTTDISGAMDNEEVRLAQDLIEGCIEFNPLIRLGVDEIKEHEYFKDVNWKTLAKDAQSVPLLLQSANITERSMKPTSTCSTIPFPIASAPGESTATQPLTTAELVSQSSPFQFQSQPLPEQILNWHSSNLCDTRKSSFDTCTPSAYEALPEIFQMSSLLDEFPKINPRQRPCSVDAYNDNLANTSSAAAANNRPRAGNLNRPCSAIYANAEEACRVFREGDPRRKSWLQPMGTRMRARSAVYSDAWRISRSNPGLGLSEMDMAECPYNRERREENDDENEIGGKQEEKGDAKEKMMKFWESLDSPEEEDLQGGQPNMMSYADAEARATSGAKRVSRPRLKLRKLRSTNEIDAKRLSTVSLTTPASANATAATVASGLKAHSSHGNLRKRFTSLHLPQLSFGARGPPSSSSSSSKSKAALSNKRYENVGQLPKGIEKVGHGICFDRDKNLAQEYARVGGGGVGGVKFGVGVGLGLGLELELPESPAPANMPSQATVATKAIRMAAATAGGKVPQVTVAASDVVVEEANLKKGKNRYSAILQGMSKPELRHLVGLKNGWRKKSVSGPTPAAKSGGNPQPQGSSSSSQGNESGAAGKDKDTTPEVQTDMDVEELRLKERPTSTIPNLFSGLPLLDLEHVYTTPLTTTNNNPKAPQKQNTTSDAQTAQTETKTQDASSSRQRADPSTSSEPVGDPTTHSSLRPPIPTRPVPQPPLQLRTRSDAHERYVRPAPVFTTLEMPVVQRGLNTPATSSTIPPPNRLGERGQRRCAEGSLLRSPTNSEHNRHDPSAFIKEMYGNNSLLSLGLLLPSSSSSSSGNQKPGTTQNSKDGGDNDNGNGNGNGKQGDHTSKSAQQKLTMIGEQALRYGRSRGCKTGALGLMSPAEVSCATFLSNTIPSGAQGQKEEQVATRERTNDVVVHIVGTDEMMPTSTSMLSTTTSPTIVVSPASVQMVLSPPPPSGTQDAKNPLPLPGEKYQDPQFGGDISKAKTRSNVNLKAGMMQLARKGSAAMQHVGARTASAGNIHIPATMTMDHHHHHHHMYINTSDAAAAARLKRKPSLQQFLPIGTQPGNLVSSSGHHNQLWKLPEKKAQAKVGAQVGAGLALGLGLERAKEAKEGDPRCTLRLVTGVNKESTSSVSSTLASTLGVQQVSQPDSYDSTKTMVDVSEAQSCQLYGRGHDHGEGGGAMRNTNGGNPADGGGGGGRKTVKEVPRLGLKLSVASFRL